MPTDLENYLDYYTSLTSPSYAVLVVGEWGTGKTYQVERYLSKINHLYVSLFGLTSPDAIRVAVLSKLAASKFSQDKTLFTKSLSGISEFLVSSDKFKPLRRLTEGAAEALMANALKSDYVVVFDDLERSNVTTKDLLGVLNHYVEELKLRVIIVANHKELKPKFTKFKEKLIGQTIEVVPQVIEATNQFIVEYPEPEIQCFLHSQRDTLLRLFADSRCPSLRVLRHVVRDLIRLRKILTPEHLANEDAVKELVGVFCARDFEIRMGNIDTKDLLYKAENPYSHLFEPTGESASPDQLSRIICSETKFPTVNFRSDLLDVNVVIDMLIKGRFVNDDVLSSINKSLHFQTPDDLPPWKVLFRLDAMENSILESAKHRMIQQIENYEITHVGEMFHVFSLMMMMSQHGIVNRTVPDVLALARSYVDQLVQDNRLELIDQQSARIDQLYSAYDGYRYWVDDFYKSEFEQFKKHVSMGLDAALRSQLPKASEKVLELMEHDSEGFVEYVCHTNSDNRNPFASVPILKQIEPSLFVNTWLKSPKSNWAAISLALDIRYTHSIRHRDLEEEHEWATEVYRCLKQATDHAQGFDVLRLPRAIPKAFKVLAGEEETSSLHS